MLDISNGSMKIYTGCSNDLHVAKQYFLDEITDVFDKKAIDNLCDDSLPIGLELVVMFNVVENNRKYTKIFNTRRLYELYDWMKEMRVIHEEDGDVLRYIKQTMLDVFEECP